MELIIKRFEALTLPELYEILQLRVAVFVVEQNCAYQEVDGRDLSAYHVFLREGGEICAYLRVLDPGVAFEEAAIGRVVAKKRGCGLGDKILKAGIAVAREKWRADSIKLEAQVSVRGFYEKVGFVQSSDIFLEDGIAHMQMTLQLGEEAPGAREAGA